MKLLALLLLSGVYPLYGAQYTVTKTAHTTYAMDATSLEEVVMEMRLRPVQDQPDNMSLPERVVTSRSKFVRCLLCSALVCFSSGIGIIIWKFA